MCPGLRFCSSMGKVHDGKVVPKDCFNIVAFYTNKIQFFLKESSMTQTCVQVTSLRLCRRSVKGVAMGTLVWETARRSCRCIATGNFIYHIPIEGWFRLCNEVYYYFRLYGGLPFKPGTSYGHYITVVGYGTDRWGLTLNQYLVEFLNIDISTVVGNTHYLEIFSDG